MYDKNSVLVTIIRVLAVAVIVLCTIALITEDSHAGSLHLLDLSEVSIDYKNFWVLSQKQYDLMTYPDPPKESLNLGIKTELFRFGYWDSTVLSLTTDSQYRMVGLQTRAGLHLSQYVDLGLYHQSLHELDRPEQTTPHFPSETGLELKVILFRKDSRPFIF